MQQEQPIRTLGVHPDTYRAMQKADLVDFVSIQGRHPMPTFMGRFLHADHSKPTYDPSRIGDILLDEMEDERSSLPSARDIADMECARIQREYAERQTFTIGPWKILQTETSGVDRLVDECHGDAVANGWWNDLATGECLLGKRNVGEMIALAHGELSEFLEADRKGGESTKIPGFSAMEEEMADLFIRCADTAGALKLRLGAAIVAKRTYNRTRKDHSREARLAAGGKKY